MSMQINNTGIKGKNSLEHEYSAFTVMESGILFEGKKNIMQR